jgi:hypothetical protein
MGRISSTCKEEIQALIPPTTFFLVALLIVSLVRALMIRGTGNSPIGVGTIVLLAIILGKAVLVADLLPFINLYPKRPLIFNIVWRTLTYAVVAILFHYAENLIEFWRKTGSIVRGNEQLLAEINWAQFAAVQILLIVMIFSYSTIRELARVIGREKLIEMFFGIHLRARNAG